MFLWIAAVTAAFVALLFYTPHLPQRRELLIVAAVAALVRLVPILLHPEQHGIWLFDAQNYERTATEVLHGRDIYRLGFFIHPYLPFQMYVFAACKLVADGLNVPFFAIVRLPTAAADVGTSLLLVAYARRRVGLPAAARTGLLYAVCPFPVLVGFYHGQFDAIPAFFTVGSFYLLDRQPLTGGRVAGSAAFLAFGVLEKIWPVFVAPLLLVQAGSPRERVAYAAIASAIILGFVLSYLLLYGSTLDVMRGQIVDYRAPYPTAAGPSLMIDRVFSFLPFADDWLRLELKHGDLLAYAIVGALQVYLIARRERVVPAAVCVLAVLFVVNNDGSAYHYIWILPLALMAGHRGFVAAITMGGTGLYVVLAFFAGGIYQPAFSGPGTAWLVEHMWYFNVANWIIFVAWSAAILVWPRREAADPGPPAQAASPSPS